jgi:large subunit ribosomal protein L5
MPDNEEELEQSDQAAEPTAEETSEPAADSVEPTAEEVSEPTAEATEPPAEEAAPARRRAPRTPRTGTRATRGQQRGGAAAVEEPPADPTDEPPPPPRMRDLYRNEIVPSMMREFGFTNPMQVPRIQKIVVNIGLGEALTNGRAMESATGDLATITGQKPIITRARKSIAGFKIREGNPIGTCVTLRGTKMYHFLDRLINMSLPRIRDFRGIPRRGFDGRGNFSIGIREQIIFPEIDYNQIDRIRGLQVTITTTAQDDATATRMLELYGMPFVREV